MISSPCFLKPIRVFVRPGLDTPEHGWLRPSATARQVASFVVIGWTVAMIAGFIGTVDASTVDAVESAAGTTSGAKPNVVFILTDDLGWGDLGCFYQNESDHVRTHQTPQLDQMAAEGLQMRAHYCPAPVCAPSRGTLLSGTHQGHCSIRDNQFDKALPDVPTLGTVMKAAGYRTWMIGKYGLQGDGKDAQSWPAYPTKRGFDEFYGLVRHVDGHVHFPANEWPLGNNESHREPKEVWHNDREISAQLDRCYTTDLFTAKAKQVLIDHKQQNSPQPFFIYLAYDTPHAALQVPSVRYPEGQGVNGGLKWLGESGRMINTATGEIDSYRHEDYLHQGWSDVEERFATMVRRIDDCVGDLLQTLRDLDLDENTIVVFTSDNGPHQEAYLAEGNYDPTSFQSYGPFDGIKRDCFEGGIRMPTIAWGPGMIPGNRIDSTPSQFHDWMTTLADLADVAPPARADGVSLVPTLTGQGEQPPSTIYIEYFNQSSTPKYEDFLASRRGQKRGQMQAVHLDGYKGVRYHIQGANDPFAIYDINRDPGEANNLADSSDAFRELQTRMQNRVTRLRRPNESAKRPYDDAPIASLADVTGGGKALYMSTASPSVSYLANAQWQSTQSNGVATPSGSGSVLQSFAESNASAGRLQGWLKVPETGRYTFSLNTPGDVVLRLHDAAVIDTTGGVTESTVRINLEAGVHPFTLILELTKKDSPPTWTIAAAGAEPADVKQYLAKQP